MSLEKYVENSWLRPEATSQQEIADQLSIVDRSLKDAAVDAISDDRRFYTAFNAILASANAALRASGYRVANQQGHHARTLETLEFTIESDPKLVRKLIGFSKKRNAASYDSAGSVSNQELQQIFSSALELQSRVLSWLKNVHPELL